MIPVSGQNRPERFVFGPVVRIRGAITKSAVKNTRFSHQGLNELSYRHTCRNCVRVNNNIRANTIFCKWHILLWDNQPDRPLLSASRAEFIANRRVSFLADTHLPDPKPGLAFRHKCFIYKPELPLFRHNGHIAHLPAFILDTHRPDTDDNFLIIHLCVFANEAIVVEIAVVIPGFNANRAFFLDIREPGIALGATDATALLAGFIHVIIRNAKQSAFDACLIEKNRVFHIVSIK